MKSTYTATAHIPIKANAERVWEALTDPELIRQYLFVTRVYSEWKLGKSITVVEQCFYSPPSYCIAYGAQFPSHTSFRASLKLR
jgi:hypothetical protein